MALFKLHKTINPRRSIDKKKKQNTHTNRSYLGVKSEQYYSQVSRQYPFALARLLKYKKKRKK